MTWLESRIPPLALVVITGGLMWGISRLAGSVAMPDGIRLGVSAVILAVGVFFCVAGVVSFRRARTTVDPRTPEAATALVDSGIYRFSRNPMYVGFAAILLSWGVFLASPWSLLGVPGFILYLNCFQITPEERALQGIFGDAYTAYRSRVRRWL